MDWKLHACLSCVEQRSHLQVDRRFRGESVELNNILYNREEAM